MNSKADPVDFLPGLIAVERRAPHPAARSTAWLLLGLFAALLAWVGIGRLDIVAVAHGKLVPATYVKIVQPAEGGIAKEILVREGQEVEAGQVLVRMDSALSDADRQALLQEQQMRQLALRRIDAQLADRPLRAEAGDDPALWAQALALHDADRRAYENRRAQELGTLDKARHDLVAAEQLRTKLEQVLPHFRSQEAAYAGLGRDGFAGRLMVTDKTRERIEKEQDLKAQQAAIAGARSAIAAAEHRLQQVTSDYRRQLQAERAEVMAQAERLKPELAKLQHRHGLLELKAPQAGSVKDLATHTPGTVVQPGTILLTLVPRGEALKAEVWVSNQDAGFVREGLRARVKVAAFPFQKYGMADGRIERVGVDAQEDGKPAIDAGTGGARGPAAAGLAYRALVVLDTHGLPAPGGGQLRLVPGMQVSAEIHLGDRTVLEYLLSPVRQAFGEAGRER